MPISAAFLVGDWVQIQTDDAAFVTAQAIGMVLRLPEDSLPFYTVQFEGRATPLLFCGDELAPVSESVSFGHP